MEVRRVISKYNNADESLIRDYSVDHIPVAKLKEILKVEPGDDEVLKVYRIDDIQLAEFGQYLPDLHLQSEELGTVEFFYECFEAN